MGILSTCLVILAKNRVYLSCVTTTRPLHHHVPIVDLYYRTTGVSLHEDQLPILSKKHPKIDKLSHEQLQYTLQILQKFGVSALDACNNLHVFSMNPINMDNYGEILKECKFAYITAQHIIKYHTIAKTKTIASLKKDGLINNDVVLEEVLLESFIKWPTSKKTSMQFSDTNTTLLTIRTSVLERYLKWRLSITTEEFQKYCHNYLPLRHRPMADIQEALDLAENNIKFDNDAIRRNGFIISSDPLNTKLILQNVPSVAGLDIRDAIKVEPAILKNNYNAILQIRDILESYRIPLKAQALCLKVYCMRSDTVKERLDELSQLKEFRILSSNPRFLSLVIHKKKFMSRLNKIQEVKKQCYSFNHLISSSKIFNNYITSFGSKIYGRDLEMLVNCSLKPKDENRSNKPGPNIMSQLRRHKFCLHVALAVIDGNIQYLKTKFDDRVISNNCQLLLYPISDIEHHIDNVLRMRRGECNSDTLAGLDASSNHLEHAALSDDQVLSLVLYRIEKKYHFSGDGIWTRQEAKADQATC